MKCHNCGTDDFIEADDDGMGNTIFWCDQCKCIIQSEWTEELLSDVWQGRQT